MHTLSDLGLDHHKIEETLAAFEGIRRTRNSLHDGGKYKPPNDREEPLAFELADGGRYTILPSQGVAPLRPIGVVRTLLAYYHEIEAAVDMEAST